MKIDQILLTAYALGELSDKRKQDVEEYLRDNEEARRYVEEIRDTAAVVEKELRKQDTPGLTLAQKQLIKSESRKETAKKKSKRGRLVVVRIVALAAMLLLVVWISTPSLLRSRQSADRARIEARMYRMNAMTSMDVSGPPKMMRRVVKGEPIPFVEEMEMDDKIGEDVDLDGGFNTESYDTIVENPFLEVIKNPLSTFSIDVDTASYSNMRRFLNRGQRPPKGAVRIEELVNYFSYDYPQPDGDVPFSVNVEIAACPWKLEHRLAKVGLKGKEIKTEKRPPANLVFLLDVSGSMNSPNKLPLVKQAMKMLVGRLAEKDTISIAVYAGASGLALPATSCEQKEKIVAALERLQPGGSTAGAAGIMLAYKVAVENFIKGGINRVVLCTDGDFNVGVTDNSSLVSLIEEKAKTGVFLSVLGFGMGNYKDSRMEKLADKGNGNYAYIDTEAEARKVLVEEMSGTLVTIAKDVKIQIEFNPSRIAGYRLIGYENRMLRKEDFNDDTKDAGEIGAGHTVTALYELIPFGTEVPSPKVDGLRYQKPESKVDLSETAMGGESFFLKLRYKEPDGDKSKLIKVPVADTGKSYARASADYKFAASVASFGMILRDSKYKGTASYDAVLELAQEGVGKDEHGYRRAFVELVKKAKRIK
ncbi:von Willebrand factor type A domain-containing protein [Planctomycetota bacterium]